MDKVSGEAQQDARPRKTASPHPSTKAAHLHPRPARAAYGALDLGTNNCRLLIARPAPDGFRVIDAFSRIVRLGEGLATTGRISPAAMQRTLAALEVCVAKLRQRGVTRLRAVATEACRRAENGDEFLEAVRSRCGLELDVIDAEEEASLARYGCAPLLDGRRRHAAIIDIGGGSTEIVWLCNDTAEGDAAAPRLRAWHSLPLGVVDLAERFGGHEVGRPVYEAMVAEVRSGLAPFVARHGLAERARFGELQMIGTSGTVTTLTGMHLDLPRYDRSQVDGAFLPLGLVEKLSEQVRAMSYRARVAHPCIGRDRADLVVAGCAILEAFWRLCPTDGLTVADRGLREGLLYLMMCEDGVWTAPAGGGA
ncbi:Ppx/GppA phosphatase family protein [Algihabitans albus]|uniref:Ppx/GppA phosphatase family protein n=1 Tax=Algihabitans albus TaxID=2164067 RepID=UPI000E5CDB16|nr:Ppx/GppA phosphatase family protein [Algihabitans albus]